MTKENPPKIIYLQWKDENGDLIDEDLDYEEITWSEDRIYEYDLIYHIDHRHLRKKKSKK